jgi:serine/threonine protein kinase
LNIWLPIFDTTRITIEDTITKINNELNHSIGAFITTQFFEEIVNGVQYLHSLSPKVIHRDLNPKNVFVTDGRDGNYIKIGDFGIAKYHGIGNNSISGSSTTQGLEKHTLKRGTRKYMAPEVNQSKDYDERCDIYSLGCIGMDLLCIDC